jgi:hypothetical protein
MATIEARIRSLRQKKYSIATIADKMQVTQHKVCKTLGLYGNTNNRLNHAKHIGGDLDATGKFKVISTMKWV